MSEVEGGAKMIILDTPSMFPWDKGYYALKQSHQIGGGSMGPL